MASRFPCTPRVWVMGSHHLGLCPAYTRSSCCSFSPGPTAVHVAPAASAMHGRPWGTLGVHVCLRSCPRVCSLAVVLLETVLT